MSHGEWSCKCLMISKAMMESDLVVRGENEYHSLRDWYLSSIYVLAMLIDAEVDFSTLQKEFVCAEVRKWVVLMCMLMEFMFIMVCFHWWVVRDFLELKIYNEICIRGRKWTTQGELKWVRERLFRLGSNDQGSSSSWISFPVCLGLHFFPYNLSKVTFNNQSFYLIFHGMTFLGIIMTMVMMKAT